jgi:hypothetical protein
VLQGRGNLGRLGGLLGRLGDLLGRGFLGDGAEPPSMSSGGWPMGAV